MATNDFLPFAAATGANVQTQADYAASSDRATGYVTGAASSTEVNKVLRQASLIASMVAQFIVDQTGQNAVDDGTIATLETNLEQAILNVAANRVIQISDVVNLTTALAGKLGSTDNAATASKLLNARLIALAGLVTGSASFDGSGNISIATSIADAALTIAKTAGLQSALDAKAGLVSPAFAGNPTAPTQSTADNSTRLATTAFARALINSLIQASPGVIQLLGFKLQYGRAVAPYNGQPQQLATVNFPVEFTATPEVFLTIREGLYVNGSMVGYLYADPTTTSFTAQFDLAEVSGSNIPTRPTNFSWFAIGY